MKRHPSEKQKTKLKSVDPFHPNNRRKAKKDETPTDSASNKTKRRRIREKQVRDRIVEDTERLPRVVKEIKERMESVPKVKSSQKRTKNTKSPSATTGGFVRKPHESDFQFRPRVANETHRFVQEQKLKIKYNVTGNPDRPEDSIEETTEREKKGRRTKRKNDEPTLPSTKRIANNDDKNKRNTTDDDRLDLLSNAREVIPFGERVDAPPKLHHSMRTKWADLKLNRHNKQEEDIPGATNRLRFDPQQRQQVVDQYRQLKKQRRLQLNITA